MLLNPLVKKQHTAQSCCYASAAKTVRLLKTTMVPVTLSLGSNMWNQETRAAQ